MQQKQGGDGRNRCRAIKESGQARGGHHPVIPEEEEEEIEEKREEGEVETAETEEDSVIMRGDNLPIVDLNKNNTDGKEAKYIRNNHIVGKFTTNKKVTEVHKKNRVRLCDGSKNFDIDDRHRSRTDPTDTKSGTSCGERTAKQSRMVIEQSYINYQ